MEFAQLVGFTATTYDDIRALGDDLVQSRHSAGGSKPFSILKLKDRDRRNT